jgi:hypothetical protein
MMGITPPSPPIPRGGYNQRDIHIIFEAHDKSKPILFSVYGFMV